MRSNIIYVKYAGVQCHTTRSRAPKVSIKGKVESLSILFEISLKKRQGKKERKKNQHGKIQEVAFCSPPTKMKLAGWEEKGKKPYFFFEIFIF